MSDEPFNTRREVLATAALVSGTVLAGCGRLDSGTSNSSATGGTNTTGGNTTANGTDTSGDNATANETGDESDPFGDVEEPPEEYPGEFTTRETGDGRTYERYVPSGYDGDGPLLVGLHGCQQDGERFARLTGFNELAEDEGFVAVYPVQPSEIQQLRCFRWWEPRNIQRGRGEVGEIAGVVEETAVSVGVDDTRVYVAGMSAGGAMVPNLLAQYPDVFAAGAIHSGTQFGLAENFEYPQTALQDRNVSPTRRGRAAYEAMGERASPVPTMVIHGTADDTVPFFHYERNVEQAIQTNSLVLDEDVPEEPTTTEERSTDAFDYRVDEYHAGDHGPVVTGLAVEEMGHAWAGGYPDVWHEPDAPEAIEYIWEFVEGRRVDDPFP